jgi:hypothetical protein
MILLSTHDLKGIILHFFSAGALKMDVFSQSSVFHFPSCEENIKPLLITPISSLKYKTILQYWKGNFFTA